MSKQRAGRKRKGADANAAPGRVAPEAPPGGRARGQGQWHWHGFFAAALVAAVCLAWANTLRAPFVLDDGESIVTNASIRDFWSLRWLNPPAGMGETVGGRPVLNFSFAVNYALGGLDVRGYHLGNMLIHAAAALALFGVARRVGRRCGARDAEREAQGAGCETEAGRGDAHGGPSSGGGGEPGGGRAGGGAGPGGDGGAGGGGWLSGAGAAGPAFAVALVWALHPLQTAAVTYVVQRAESLAGLFYLLTLYCFIRAAEAGARREEGHGQDARAATRRARRWGALAAAACALGMGTKETVVTAPLVALLLDRAFFAGSFREAWRRRRRLYGGLAATWLLLGALVLSNAGRGGSVGPGSEVGAWAYLLTQCGAIVRYLGLACLPAPLVFDHGTPVAAGPGAVWWQALVLCALAAGTLRALRRNHAAGFLGAWFFLMLAPSSSFMPVSTQTIAEHRMYLTLAAVAALACAGARRGLARMRAARWWGAAALACAAAALGAATVARNAVYRTAVSLWADTVEKCPDNPRARNNLGAALSAAGRTAEAAEQFRRAIALRPNHAFAHLNLGVALMLDPRAASAAGAASRGATAARDGGAAPADDTARRALADDAARRAEAARQAEHHFRAALAAEPGNTDARVNLGKLLADSGRAAEAMEHYRAALAGDPAAQDARVNLAALLAAGGREAEGAALLREALAAEPGLAEAHYHLGLVLDKSGARREAEAEFRAAARLKPGMAAAHLALGNCLARRGDAGAESCYREALRLDPKLAEAWYALGNGFAKQERFSEAMEAYRKALQLDPAHVQALNNLGNCQLVTGRVREAVETYEEVLRRRPGDATVRQNLDYARELLGAR
ncbi:MAG: tetratricopeptide repeat protein [Opitutaceae bacterium]|jgi:Flp pilus assembly protein TadD|nr:tetratricopeptide repeat protein [Opitutaceae bacterium]